MVPQISYAEQERLATFTHDLTVLVDMARGYLSEQQPAEAMHELAKLHERIHKEQSCTAES